MMIKTSCHRLRLLMLHLPDAAKVVIAIRTHRRVGRTVHRTTRVVVDDGLIVEIDDIKRTIGTDAILDGTEPEVFAADELGFFATGFFVRFIADAVFLDELVMHDVQRGLGGEVAVVPLLRPGTAFIDGTTRGGGEAADKVDLHVGLLGPGHEREGLLTSDHAFVAGGAGDLAFGQHILG